VIDLVVAVHETHQLPEVDARDADDEVYPRAFHALVDCLRGADHIHLILVSML